ncbi:MAG: hypothetical protein QOG15_30 [Solirubrobacteraceae bacterium]|jgi:DNA-binding CsgD family transcriptional regulator|nr:hypothetical protein [Solirubrobacteraceae bacterium]
MGGLLLIEGPAGLGKTRLGHQARAIATGLGVTTLAARGGELERDVPFGIARQLFERLVTRAAEPERDQLLRGAAAVSMMSLGLEADRERPQARGDAEQTALHGLYCLCANLAERGPLLLSVDDVQWSDRRSLDWLRYLVRRLDELPVLVLAAARTDDPAKTNEALTELAADASAGRMRLDPLSNVAVGTLIGAALGGEPHAEFVDACLHATGGNPFLLHELIHALREEALAPTASAAARVGDLGSTTVAGSLATRLDRSRPEAASLARAVALLGTSCELQHAAQLAGLDAGTADAAADALVAGGVLAPGRPLEFIHPIVRQSIYGEMAMSERTRGHARAAAILQQSGAGLDEVAVQLLATEPDGRLGTVESLRRAARAAAVRGAVDAAISYLRRALREPPASGERASLLLELGALESRAADPEAIGHLSEAAEVAGDPRVRARAYQRLGFTLIMAGRAPDVEAAYNSAISVASEAHPDLALELEAELVASAQMGMMPSTIVGERLARHDRDSIKGTTVGERLLLGTLAFEALRRNDPARVAVELAERAIAGYPAPSEGLLDSPPQTLALLTLLYSDRLALVGRIWQEASDLAIAQGSQRGFIVASTFHAFASMYSGAVGDAEDEALSIMEIGGLYEPGVQLLAASCVARARVHRGDLSGAEAALEAVGVMSAPPEEVFLEEPLYARGTLRLAQGQPAGALADLLAVGARMRATGACGVGQYPWRSQAALAYAALGELDDALRLADEELALARDFGTSRTVGSALQVCGLLAEGTRRIDLLDAASAALKDSPARLEHARTLVYLGAMLRRAGRRSAARHPLAQGREIAVRCGAHALADEATAELAAAGARPRRIVRTGVAALTVSQRRVAQMAARGLRNPEIAQGLFISRKTVEMHLSHTYRALGISCREELSAALADPSGERTT